MKFIIFVLFFLIVMGAFKFHSLKNQTSLSSKDDGTLMTLEDLTPDQRIKSLNQIKDIYPQKNFTGILPAESFDTPETSDEAKPDFNEIDSDASPQPPTEKKE